ncbi:MAG TPA: hypothetical protein VF762_13490, partial [Blastocatellia bacterium]
MRYYVEIESAVEGYAGRYHQGRPAAEQPFVSIALGRDDRLSINGSSHSLGDLTEKLIGYQPDTLQNIFNEHGQLELGQYLFSQVFGRAKAASMLQLQHERVEVRIITSDEHIARLPWVLLADRGIFLSNIGWSVSLSSNVSCNDCEVPPSPRILVVMPEPVGYPETGAAAHLEDLEDILSGANHLHRMGR